jgi:hypothetical protein
MEIAALIEVAGVRFAATDQLAITMRLYALRAEVSDGK